MHKQRVYANHEIGESQYFEGSDSMKTHRKPVCRRYGSCSSNCKQRMMSSLLLSFTEKIRLYTWAKQSNNGLHVSNGKTQKKKTPTKQIYLRVPLRSFFFPMLDSTKIPCQLQDITNIEKMLLHY